METNTNYTPAPHITPTQADMAKRAGFDVPVDKYYYANKDHAWSTHCANHNAFDYAKSCPDIDTMTRWLRSKGLHVQPTWTPDSGWYCIVIIMALKEKITFYGYSEPDDAHKAGITRALEILLEKK